MVVNKMVDLSPLILIRLTNCLFCGHLACLPASTASGGSDGVVDTSPILMKEVLRAWQVSGCHPTQIGEWEIKRGEKRGGGGGGGGEEDGGWWCMKRGRGDDKNSLPGGGCYFSMMGQIEAVCL